MLQSFDEQSLTHPVVEMSSTDGLPKPYVSTRATFDKQLSPMKCCIPSFTFTALRSFLQVPLFAEELLKHYSTAKCLLRLALGVTDDGKGRKYKLYFRVKVLSQLPLAK